MDYVMVVEIVNRFQDLKQYDSCLNVGETASFVLKVREQIATSDEILEYVSIALSAGLNLRW
jgi:hypothetical protein